MERETSEVVREADGPGIHGNFPRRVPQVTTREAQVRRPRSPRDWLPQDKDLGARPAAHH